MKKKTVHIVMAIATGLLAAVFSGLAVALHRNTLIEWWKPAIGALAVALIAGTLSIRLMRVVTRMDSRPINFACGTILFFALFIGGFYALNYYNSESSTNHKCEVVVETKYVEEHYHVKRLSRHRSIRGEKRRVYYIDIRFPEGKIKKLEVCAREYGNLRPGQKLRLEIENGLLGVPVIKNLTVPIREYKRFSRL